MGKLKVRKIAAFAPAKTILFGEHFVVWGAKGIACGIEPCNKIEIEAEEAPAPSFHYITEVGTIDAKPDGKIISGEKSLAPAAAAYALACKKWKGLLSLKVKARANASWNMKGVGNSASFCAALACALAKAAGEKTSQEGMFEVAQEADRVAHGGSPSGIDAAAVSMGGALLAQKKFGKDAKYEFSRIEARIPAGWKFILIDTSREGEERAKTSVQIAKFARSFGMEKNPADATVPERHAITSLYGDLFDKARSALANGWMEEVGQCMNENHALLRAHGVSCPRTEEAVSLAFGAGADGAKLTGAGGEGGAVLALVRRKNEAAVLSALKKRGFSTFEFAISEKGAHCE